MGEKGSSLKKRGGHVVALVCNAEGIVKRVEDAFGNEIAHKYKREEESFDEEEKNETKIDQTFDKNRKLEELDCLFLRDASVRVVYPLPCSFEHYHRFPRSMSIFFQKKGFPSSYGAYANLRLCQGATMLHVDCEEKKMTKKFIKERFDIVSSLCQGRSIGDPGFISSDRTLGDAQRNCLKKYVSTEERDPILETNVRTEWHPNLTENGYVALVKRTKDKRNSYYIVVFDALPTWYSEQILLLIENNEQNWSWEKWAEAFKEAKKFAFERRFKIATRAVQAFEQSENKEEASNSVSRKCTNTTTHTLETVDNDHVCFTSDAHLTTDVDWKNGAIAVKDPHDPWRGALLHHFFLPFRNETLREHVAGFSWLLVNNPWTNETNPTKLFPMYHPLDRGFDVYGYASTWEIGALETVACTLEPSSFEMLP